MKHEMNEFRRSAFELMARQSRRYTRKGNGTIVAALPMQTYFEGEVMGRELAINLARLGWLTRLPGRLGRPTQITLTEVGLWILGGAS